MSVGPTMRRCTFQVGQVVHHQRYDYRGVIVDVDPSFQGAEEWYTSNRTQPDKNQPWYHVLVHGSAQQTYVAEQNLEPDSSGKPVTHPALQEHFTDFRDGRYHAADRVVH